MQVDLSTYFDDDDFYTAQNIAMAEWLAQKPQEAWVWVAKDLNYDCAVPVIRWMIDQPDCDLAVAAIFFWTIMPEMDDEDDRYNEEDLPLITSILEKERHPGFASAGFKLPSAYLVKGVNEFRASSRGYRFVDLPSALTGPFEVWEGDPPPAYDARRNATLRDLFEGLGTTFKEME